MKVVTIVKDDGITGIEYGTIEVPEQRKQNNRKALFAIVWSQLSNAKNKSKKDEENTLYFDQQYQTQKQCKQDFANTLCERAIQST